MVSLISKLSPAARRALCTDLNYLNLAEIEAYCRQRGIPYSIWIETADGRRVKTGEDDRKGVILERIRAYLKSGTIHDATCFPARVVCADAPPKAPKASDSLFYGHYDPKRSALISLLVNLTGGKFRHGALARILAREFWSKGVAPTYAEFAAAWLDVQANHTRPNPEWAFLSDRSDGKETADWRRLRTGKAKKVLGILNRLGPK